MHQTSSSRWLRAAAAIVLSGAFSAACVAAQATPSAAYGKLPLSFEANEGQFDRAIRFLCRGGGYTMFLTATEAVLSLESPRHGTAVVRLQLAGANHDPRVIGMDPLPTRSNYFIGNDPRQWHARVAHYARVRVEGVYPGVDVVYGGDHRQLEYDLVLAPGADPGRLRLAFSGTDAITIGARGELILRTAAGDLVQPAPTVYQELGAQRQRVEGRYVLLPPAAAKGRAQDAPCLVGFAIGRYDRSRPLVIDPILSYSTFLGGSGDDSAIAVAVDGDGNAYVTGITTSPTFPGVTGSSIQPANAGLDDGFVIKLPPLSVSTIVASRWRRPSTAGNRPARRRSWS
jgi:hypothetical protein